MLVCVVFMRVQIAIFLVGLTTPISATLVIPSLVRYVIQPWGQENVDFFVHTSPMDSIVMDDSDIIDSYARGLGSCLQGIVVDKKFRETETVYVRAKTPILFDTEQACQSTIMQSSLQVERDDCVKVEMCGKDVWVPRIYDPPTSHLPYFQFHRLANLYPCMLAEERRARRRYSHVVRMRTDAIQYYMWDRIPQFHKIIPPLSQVVSGPGFNNLRNPSYIFDNFWIASRAAASSVFVGFSHSLETQVDRKELFDYFNCSWPPNFTSGCFDCIFGHSSCTGLVWPEIRKCSKVGTTLYSFLWRKTMSEMYKVKFEQL
jgi:hypothetical protein